MAQCFINSALHLILTIAQWRLAFKLLCYQFATGIAGALPVSKCCARPVVTKWLPNGQFHGSCSTFTVPVV